MPSVTKEESSSQVAHTKSEKEKEDEDKDMAATFWAPVEGKATSTLHQRFKKGGVCEMCVSCES